MSTNSSEDLNNQVLIGECSSVLRQVNIEADHLYRHLTEVNGKDTRVSHPCKGHECKFDSFLFREVTSRVSWSSKMSSSK